MVWRKNSLFYFLLIYATVCFIITNSCSSILFLKFIKQVEMAFNNFHLNYKIKIFISSSIIFKKFLENYIKI